MIGPRISQNGGMDALLVVAVLLLLFAIGPFVAMLDVLSRELFSDDGEGVDARRVAKAMLVLFVPLAWIGYFLFFRRRPPFA
jgi:hypothetical protein